MSINKARIAAELLGVGSADGTLQRLTIAPQVGELVEALFNPAEIALSSLVAWEQERPASYAASTAATVSLEFRGVQAQTLSVELFFDTYESRAAMSFKDAVVSQLPLVGPGRDATDVRRYTERVAKLAEVDRTLHYPPVCKLRWGAFEIFTGVLNSLDQRFTLFLENGTPVRATLSCGFIGVAPEAQRRAGELQSSDVAKTRQVRRNDTLHSIAAEEYRDPAMWRYIAGANGIVDPLDLAPGTVLTIPRLRP